MKKISMLVLAVAVLAGCANNPAVSEYYKAKGEESKAAAARSIALAEATKSPDQTTAVAAVLTLALDGKSGGGQSTIAPPQQDGGALGWASLLLNTGLQAFGLHVGKQIQIHGQDSNVMMDASRNSMIGNLAGSGGSTTTTTINASGTSSSVNTGSGTSNTGRVSSNDATAPATVVTQPPVVVVDPVIVNQPLPIICTASGVCAQ